MSYNEELQSNNGELEEILRQVNALPNANPEVTAETIVSALGYTPAKQEDVSTLSEQKANKQGLSLGVGEDGLVYLFVDGAAQGNGLDIKAEVVSGDVIGYVDNDNNIILTGALADGTYVLKYEDTEGNLTEIGSMKVGNGAAYINLADPTSADWLTNKRLNTAGEIKDQTGSYVTNYIPVKAGDVIRVRGLNIRDYGAGNNATTHFYNSSKVSVSSIVPNNVHSTIPLNGTEFTYTVGNGLSGDTASIQFVRFTGILFSGYTVDDIIITVNEEITD